MKANEAYYRIVYAINNKFDKKDKFLKRIYNKSKKFRYFRVPEYEVFIIKDIKFCYLYARDIVHGRLPEHMHNLMLCEALSNSENPYVEKYFKICKGEFSIWSEKINPYKELA